MQVCEIGEARAIVSHDSVKPAVQFVGVVFAAHCEDGSEVRHGADPVACEDDGDAQLQPDDSFSDSTFAGQQCHVVQWYAVKHYPRARWCRDVLPAGEIEKL